MFFGGKPKPEAIDPNGLELLLNSSFDKKLSGLDSKASRTAKDLESAKSKFSDACQKFDEVTAEPQLEYFFIDNVNFIKGQKIAYSKALRRIISEWDPSDGTASTIHGRYSTILSNTERFREEVLRTNANFKKVLQAYPGHLDLFKGSFSLIERLTESLRNELGRTSPALSEYRTLNDKISKLHLLIEETESIKRELSQNEGAPKPVHGAMDAEVDRISKSISAKQKELSETSGESSQMQQKIMHLVAPLERPSKKFDHIVQRKRGLNSFISSPIINLNSEADHSALINLLNEMKEKLDSGDIEEKNPERIKESIAELADSNIYAMVVKYKDLLQKVSFIRDEAQSLGAELAKLNEAKNSSRKASESKESMRRRATEIAANAASTKNEVERLFLEYYDKRISITML